MEYVCTHVQYLYNVCMCHVGMHVVKCVLHIILNECVRECNYVYMCASSVPVQYTWHVRGYVRCTGYMCTRYMHVQC